MSFEDNRQYIEALELTGDVVHINEEVDWDLEVGAISRLSCEMGAPGPWTGRSNLIFRQSLLLSRITMPP